LIENFGIGVDIVDALRFKKIPYKSNKSFYNKIFNSSELEYCLKFNNPYLHFAGKFALKEATKKAIKENISMKNIHTSYVDFVPTIKLDDDFLRHYKFLATLTHEKELAIAFVIVEQCIKN